MKMLGIGIVGLGDHVVRSHLPFLSEMPDCTIIGAYDPAPEGIAFSRAQKSCGVSINAFDSFEDLIQNSNVDAVLISSPDRFHTEQMAACIHAGKHVFCEKPLCNSIDEVSKLEDILEIAQEKELIITSCHPRRCDPPFQWLQKNLANLIEAYGDPISFNLDFSYHMPSPDKAHLHGGSLLQDHANHEIDYLHFVLGHQNFSAWKLHDSFDRYHLSGQRDDGIVFHFMGTRRLDSHIYPENISLRFDRASLYIDTYNQDQSYIYAHELQKRVSIEPGITDYEKRFAEVNKLWIGAILGHNENYLSSSDLLINSKMSVAFSDAEMFQSL